jgi:type IV pilus assembly protein PilX
MMRDVRASRRIQRGVSLIVVMVVLLLGTLLMLGSTRVGTMHGALVGSESDSQLAFAAAEAVMRDAELDIRGRRANGQPCSSDPTAAVGCRALTGPFFPEGDDDLDMLAAAMPTDSASPRCRQGICLPTNVDDLKATAWTTNLAIMKTLGATYGQFTGTTPTAASNPLLNATPPQAWYWVEVFRYSDASGILSSNGSQPPSPDMIRHPFVYRITIYVEGNKPSTRAQLRSVLVPYPNPNYE